MADPINALNPVTVHFVATSPTKSQSTPVTAANPLPVTIAAGGADADVNLAGINGVAPSVGSGAVGTGVQRVELANNGTGRMATVDAVTAITNPVAATQSGAWDPGPYSYSRKTADGQVKATAGFLHTVTISPTGAVTAGVLSIYDNAAETGTVVASFSLPVTTFTPFSVQLDVTMTAGIYVGFDATLANVGCTVSYR